MVDKEMLSAMSDMLDEKLGQKLEPLYDKMDSMEKRMDSIEEKLDSVERRLDSVEERLDSVEEKIGCIEGEIGSIKVKIGCIEGEIGSIEEEIGTMNKRLDNVEQDVHHIKVIQLENSVIPRLSTIESCYVDTYKRYQKDTEKIDGMIQDIDILKLTVSEHSGRLAQLPV